MCKVHYASTHLYLFSLMNVPSALVPGLVKGELPTLRIPDTDKLARLLVVHVGILCRITLSSLNPTGCPRCIRENFPPPLPNPLSVGLPGRICFKGYTFCTHSWGSSQSFSVSWAVVQMSVAIGSTWIKGGFRRPGNVADLLQSCG